MADRSARAMGPQTARPSSKIRSASLRQQSQSARKASNQRSRLAAAPEEGSDRENGDDDDHDVDEGEEAVAEEREEEVDEENAPRRAAPGVSVDPDPDFDSLSGSSDAAAVVVGGSPDIDFGKGDEDADQEAEEDGTQGNSAAAVAAAGLIEQSFGGDAESAALQDGPLVDLSASEDDDWQPSEAPERRGRGSGRSGSEGSDVSFHSVGADESEEADEAGGMDVDFSEPEEESGEEAVGEAAAEAEADEVVYFEAPLDSQAEEDDSDSDIVVVEPDEASAGGDPSDGEGGRGDTDRSCQAAELWHVVSRPGQGNAGDGGDDDDGVIVIDDEDEDEESPIEAYDAPPRSLDRGEGHREIDSGRAEEAAEPSADSESPAAQQHQQQEQGMVAPAEAAPPAQSSRLGAAAMADDRNPAVVGLYEGLVAKLRGELAAARTLQAAAEADSQRAQARLQQTQSEFARFQVFSEQTERSLKDRLRMLLREESQPASSSTPGASDAGTPAVAQDDSQQLRLALRQIKHQLAQAESESQAQISRLQMELGVERDRSQALQRQVETLLAGQRADLARRQEQDLHSSGNRKRRRNHLGQEDDGGAADEEDGDVAEELERLRLEASRLRQQVIGLEAKSVGFRGMEPELERLKRVEVQHRKLLQSHEQLKARLQGEEVLQEELARLRLQLAAARNELVNLAEAQSSSLQAEESLRHWTLHLAPLFEQAQQQVVAGLPDAGQKQTLELSVDSAGSADADAMTDDVSAETASAGSPGPPSLTPQLVSSAIQELREVSLRQQRQLGKQEAELRVERVNLQETQAELAQLKEQAQQTAEELAQARADLETAQRNLKVAKRRSQGLTAVLQSYDADDSAQNHDTQRIVRLQQLEEELAAAQTELQAAQSQGQQQLVEIRRLNKLVERLEEQAEHALRRAGRGDFDPSTTKVLHLRQNPAAEAAKSRPTLAELHAEIARLRQQLEKANAAADAAALPLGGPLIDLGPDDSEDDEPAAEDPFLSPPAARGRGKASSASAAAEVAQLQALLQQSRTQITKLEQQAQEAEKRYQRLNELFRKKVSEFREASYMITGYKVEMINDTIYRLRSMFAERPEDCLEFRKNSEGKLQLLATPFAQDLDKDTLRMLKRFDNIPAFVATVTLNLFSRVTKFVQ